MALPYKQWKIATGLEKQAKPGTVSVTGGTTTTPAIKPIVPAANTGTTPAPGTTSAPGTNNAAGVKPTTHNVPTAKPQISVTAKPSTQAQQAVNTQPANLRDHTVAQLRAVPLQTQGSNQRAIEAVMPRMPKVYSEDGMYDIWTQAYGQETADRLRADYAARNRWTPDRYKAQYPGIWQSTQEQINAEQYTDNVVPTMNPAIPMVGAGFSAQSPGVAVTGRHMKRDFIDRFNNSPMPNAADFQGQQERYRQAMAKYYATMEMVDKGAYDNVNNAEENYLAAASMVPNGVNFLGYQLVPSLREAVTGGPGAYEAAYNDRLARLQQDVAAGRLTPEEAQREAEKLQVITGLGEATGRVVQDTAMLGMVGAPGWLIPAVATAGHLSEKGIDSALRGDAQTRGEAAVADRNNGGRTPELVRIGSANPEYWTQARQEGRDIADDFLAYAQSRSKHQLTSRQLLEISSTPGGKMAVISTLYDQDEQFRNNLDAFMQTATPEELKRLTAQREPTATDDRIAMLQQGRAKFKQLKGMLPGQTTDTEEPFEFWDTKMGERIRTTMLDRFTNDDAFRDQLLDMATAKGDAGGDGKALDTIMPILERVDFDKWASSLPREQLYKVCKSLVSKTGQEQLGKMGGKGKEIMDKATAALKSANWEQWKQHPEDTHLFASLWLRSKGWNTLADWAEDPLKFYAGSALLLLGGGALVGSLFGGDDDEDEEERPRRRASTGGNYINGNLMPTLNA